MTPHLVVSYPGLSAARARSRWVWATLQRRTTVRPWAAQAPSHARAGRPRAGRREHEPNGQYWRVDLSTLSIADDDNNRIMTRAKDGKADLFAEIPSPSAVEARPGTPGGTSLGEVTSQPTRATRQRLRAGQPTQAMRLGRRSPGAGSSACSLSCTGSSAPAEALARRARMSGWPWRLRGGRRGCGYVLAGGVTAECGVEGEERGRTVSVSRRARCRDCRGGW